MLLRQGVTAHEFARAADEAFVLAAVDVLTQQGTDPSFSRISAITGLHRHAVSAILAARDQAAAQASEPKEYERHRLARVLGGWFEDPRYTGTDGRPSVLRLDGPEPSFESLVKDFSGDIYPGIILEELERVGAVQRTEGGRIAALSRRYSAGGASPETMRHMEGVAADVVRTLEFNLEAPPDKRLLEDSAISADLPADLVPVLARMLKRRTTSFLDDVEGWLEQHESPDTGVAGDTKPRVRAGVRVVMVVEPSPGVQRA